jgi:iron complex outermembrane recepter protein
MKSFLLFIPFVAAFSAGMAQVPADTSAVNAKVYILGEVSVSASADRMSISGEKISSFNAKDLSSSLSSLPSLVVTSGGSRNEGGIYLHGFDVRSVPVFLDGIPVYVPFDGYIDLGRFTMYDISRVDVSKGFASLSYGPNTIGGAINLVGLKPSQKLEVSARAGIMSGKAYETNLNLGSRIGKFYIQTGFSILQKEYMRLSAAFDTSSRETDHKRDNSNRLDLKESFRIGFTPNATDEYSINFISSHGEKGNPVYLGSDSNTKLRYWDWPYYDKKSIYYISKTRLGSKSFLQARLYYDRFQNEVRSFDDKTYTTQKKGYAFNSFYDDHSIGGNLEFNRQINTENQLKLSAHLKNDNHSEKNNEEPFRHYADNTWSVSLENTYKPGAKLSFIPGISYNYRQSLRAENYNSKDTTISDFPSNGNGAINAQLSSAYAVSNKLSLILNISEKTRFATMKDRYSYKLGTALPNPDLKAENSLNLELSARIKLSDRLHLSPEIFMSDLNNTIQSVSNVQGDLFQMQNTGRARFAGADITADYQPVTGLDLYAAYSYISRKNLSNSALLFTDVPDHKVFASAEYSFAKNMLFGLFGEYNSKRNSSSDGTRVAEGYFLLNCRYSVKIAKYFSIEAGINNLTDKNYSVQEGYPEAGRNYYAAVIFRLH